MADNNSDDDFESTSPRLSQTQVRRNLKIPIGHILAAAKWNNSTVCRKLSETITVLYSSSLGVVDFHPSGDCAVIFLSAAEVIEGQLFKRRLAGLRSVKGIRKVVIAERTLLSLQQFDALQQFAVLELGIDLIPISENCLHILLIQMVYAENKIAKNPFLTPIKVEENDKDHMISTLKNIPKLGDKKIAQLLTKYPSLQRISSASVEELSELLGYSLADLVWEYFNK